MAIDNIEAGKVFCKNARKIMKRIREAKNKPVSKNWKTKWWSDNYMLRFAKEYNIEGVFVNQTVNDVKHWRFMYAAGKDSYGQGTMKVYDPLALKGDTLGTIYSEQPSKDVFICVTKGILNELDELSKSRNEEREKQGIAEREAVGVSKRGGIDIPMSTGYVQRTVDDLASIGYDQYVIDMGKIQKDGHNCGPLSAYAAAVANVHTPKYREKVNARKIAGELRVSIV